MIIKMSDRPVLLTTTKNVIEVNDWDEFVSKTYGRPYNLQQQDGCMERGVITFTVPCTDGEDYDNDSIEEDAFSKERGVSFKAWLTRDPNKLIPENDYTEIWWERNFYPDYYMVIKDLESKGLLPAGEYLINIDW